MSAEAFMAWYDARQDGERYELLDGLVQPNDMQGERLQHAETKARITDQFRAEIRSKKLPCQGLGDGMAVRVDDKTIFEPDALVRCGPKLPDETTIILDPMIVVEVVSPSSQRIDALTKLAHYFRNPHIIHYLIVISSPRQVIHHRRGEGTGIITSIHHAGVIEFAPPGLSLTIADIFASDEDA
jgi:Uma2 family endonuclease